MTQSKDDETGLLTVLVKRTTEVRLPRAEELKAKVDAGGLLNDRDLAFLEEVMADARSLSTLWERHPEYREIGLRMLDLYKEISARALRNQQAARAGGENVDDPTG